jgi:cytochrome c-type biogenesis protein
MTITMATTSLSWGLAWTAGVLTVLSPCILPVLPILLGRALQSHRFGPVALVAGLTLSFAAFGSLLGITASWLTELTNLLRGTAIALLLVLGSLAIFPQWSYWLTHRLPWGKMLGSRSAGDDLPPGLWREFCLGCQLGLLWTPCAGPALGAILLLAAAGQQVGKAFGLLLVYGLGASLPMLVVAYGGRSISQRLLKLRVRTAALQRLAGVMIVATAVAILLGWDVQVQLWLAPLFPPQTL